MALDYIRRVAGPYSGTGTTELPFGFYCYDEGDIAVVVSPSDASLDYTFLVNGTDFTVTLNDDQETTPGGTVSLVVPLVEPEVAVVISAMDYAQTTELTNYSRFPPTVINTALDRIEVQVQQLFEAIGRCVKLPLTYNATSEDFLRLLFDARDTAAQAAESAKTSASEAADSLDAVTKIELALAEIYEMLAEE